MVPPSVAADSVPNAPERPGRHSSAAGGTLTGRRSDQRRSQLFARLYAVQQRVQVEVLSTRDEFDGSRVDAQLAQPAHELLVHVGVRVESVGAGRGAKLGLRRDSR